MNGLIEQRFKEAFSNRYENNEYKFPVAFNTTSIYIVANAIHDAGNVNITLNVISISKTGFKCYATYGGGVAVETMMCIVSGY